MKKIYCTDAYIDFNLHVCIFCTGCDSERTWKNGYCGNRNQKL